jgi:hypothetical protein
MTPSNTAFNWSLGRMWVSPPAMPTTTHMVSMAMQLIKSVLYPGVLGPHLEPHLLGKFKGNLREDSRI